MPRIYQYNSFVKELRLDFRDQKSGRIMVPRLGIFSALMALALHFILQTMTDTVLSDAIPEFMARSNFTLISTYNLVYLMSFLVFFAINYRSRTFAEVQKNHWYLQAKMGYKPSVLVLNKVLARLFSAMTSFVTGFATILLIGFFLKYNFIPSYTLTLFLSGLGDSLIVLIMILTTSILVQDSTNNVWFVILVGVIHQVAKHESGRYELISQPTLMRDFQTVFNVLESPYLIYVISITLTCFIFVLVGARYSAFYFHYDRNKTNTTPKGLKIGRLQKNKVNVRKEDLLGTVERGDHAYPIVLIPKPGQQALHLARLSNILLTIIASIMIVLMLIFNVFVLFISAAQKSTEVSIRGTIPYLFHSETMDPAIARNDLVYFQQIDEQSKLQIGDIVILRDKYEVFIERIIDINDKQITVDIDNYPELTKEDAMLKTVDREAIYGRYSGRNRWLGALIHFTNTIIGRILFLLIPSILLFYHDKILKLLERFFHKEVDEEAIESQRALHEKRQLARLHEKENT